MNAKKNIKTLISAGMCVAMLSTPTPMVAAETSAHVPNSVEAQQIQELLPVVGIQKSFRDVRLSEKWLRQVRLDGMMFNIRLHTPMGEEVIFRESLMAAPSNKKGMCLYLRASSSGDALTMQLDQPAIDALNNLNIIEIAVADRESNVRAHYMVSDLQAVREALGLTAAELLCVTGEDAPVTVVSEDGVRRQINP